MANLLDHIFEKLDLQHLNRAEVAEHLRYLEEIIIPTMPVSDQVKFLAYKVRLNRRLVQLDKSGYNFVSNVSLAPAN